MKFRSTICCVVLGMASGSALGVPPTINVVWDDQGTQPVEDVDYRLEEATPGFIDVELISEQDTWRIWSTDADNPGGIGDIGVISIADDHTGAFYGLSIGPGGADPGARHVKGIDLWPFGFTGPAARSKLAHGRITGDLTGVLKVKRSSTGQEGWVASFFIDGNVTGAMTIPVLKSLTIGGELSSTIDITDEVNGGGLTINGNVTTTGAIQIANFVSGNVTIGSPWNQFAGILDLENGVPSGITVEVKSRLASAASIDLNSQAVAGTLKCSTDNAGDIINGGAVTGTVTLASGTGWAFSGTATFASVSSGGVIKTTNGANLSGNLTINSDAQGDIELAALSGSVSIGGNLTADLNIGADLAAGADVTVSGALVGLGRVIIDGECAGDILIRNQTDDLTLIQCKGGLPLGGEIRINTGGGNYSADGTIRVGYEFTPFPLPDITFDGCIKVHADGSLQESGLLNGTIGVIGCYATATDLNICFDTRRSTGNVDIVQTDCTNQVGWSCGGCP